MMRGKFRVSLLRENFKRFAKLLDYKVLHYAYKITP